MADPKASTRDRETVLPDPLLDIDEVADFLGLCRATVRRETARGHLRGQKVAGRLRYKRDDVLAYADGETPAATAERDDWDAHIRKVVAKAPPFTPEQVAALSALLDWEPDNNGAP